VTVASQGEDEDASGLDVLGAVRAWRRGHRGGLAASWRPCSQPWSGCSGAVEEKGGEGGGAGWREQSGGCAWGEGRRLAARLL